MPTTYPFDEPAQPPPQAHHDLLHPLHHVVILHAGSVIGEEAMSAGNHADGLTATPTGRHK